MLVKISKRWLAAAISVLVAITLFGCTNETDKTNINVILDFYAVNNDGKYDKYTAVTDGKYAIIGPDKSEFFLFYDIENDEMYEIWYNESRKIDNYKDFRVLELTAGIFGAGQELKDAELVGTEKIESIKCEKFTYEDNDYYKSNGIVIVKTEGGEKVTVVTRIEQAPEDKLKLLKLIKESVGV